MNPGQSERLRKAAKPHLYCPTCLWMTGDGRACPRHGGPPWTPAWQLLAQAISRGEISAEEAHRRERPVLYRKEKS